MKNNSVDQTIPTSEHETLTETRPPMVALSAYVNSFTEKTLPTVTAFYQELLAKFPQLVNNSLYHGDFIARLTDWLSSTPKLNSELNFRKFVEKHAPYLIGEDSNVIIEDFVFYPGWFPIEKSEKPIFFADILFDGVCFANCNLQKISFERAIITGSSFLGAKLDESAFTNSELNYVDFKDADLSKIEISNTTGIGCRFDDANLEKAEIADHSSFQGCSFQGASMQKLSMEAFMDGNDSFEATLKKAEFSCDTVFETGKYLVLENAAILAKNYANYFPGPPRNDGSLCGQDHENSARYLQTLTNSSTPSPLVPAFVCGTRFDGSNLGQNTVFFNATGKDGRAALGSQGASIPNMSISFCDDTSVIIGACAFIGIPAAVVLLLCLSELITSLRNRILGPDVSAVAANNPNGGDVAVDLGESSSCGASSRTENTSLLPSSSVTTSLSRPSSTAVSLPPIQINQKRYERVLEALGQLDASLISVPQNVDSSLTLVPEKEKMLASKVSFFGPEGEKLQEKVLALKERAEKEKIACNYICGITFDIMDNPAFVQGEGVYAEYSLLLKSVNDRKLGLQNTPVKNAAASIIRPPHMSGAIDTWLKGLEREVERLEAKFAKRQRQKEALSSDSQKTSVNETQMRCTV